MHNGMVSTLYLVVISSALFVMIFSVICNQSANTKPVNRNIVNQTVTGLLLSEKTFI
jgi:hypothetical protein